MLDLSGVLRLAFGPYPSRQQLARQKVGSRLVWREAIGSKDLRSRLTQLANHVHASSEFESMAYLSFARQIGRVQVTSDSDGALIVSKFRRNVRPVNDDVVWPEGSPH
jgi:hypothetical protein